MNEVPDEYDRYVDSVEVIRETEDEPAGPTIPFDQTIGLALVAMLTAIAGAHRNGTTDRAVRAVRLRWQRPGGSPETDVERAFNRLELLVAQTVRERRPGETERNYLNGLSGFGADERVERVVEIHERARYGNGVDESEADEAIRIVDELVEETTAIGRIGF